MRANGNNRTLPCLLSRRQLFAEATALSLAAVLAACGGTGQQTTPTPNAKPSSAAQPTTANPTAAGAATTGGKAGGTFNLSWAGPPIGFLGDFNAMSALGTSWFSKYFSSLVAWDPKFTAIHGELADKWDISADQKTWTFKLHDGIKFHDGQPLTADDVNFTIHLVLNKDFPARASSVLNVIDGAAEFTAGQADHVRGITVVDPTTIKITTTEPQASLLNSLAQTWILPKHALASIPAATLTKSDWWKTTPIGSGPFKFVQQQADQFVELAAFPDYFRGAPKIARIVNRIYKEPGTALLALEKGEIDFTYVAQDEATRLQSNAKITVLPGPSLVPNNLLFNLDDPRFKDQRVRQAFMYALDRKNIVDKLFKGAATLIQSPFSLAQYLPPDLNTYGLDVTKAKVLLKEANWKADDTVEMLTWYNDQLSQDIYVALQQQFAAAGIKVQPRMVDIAAFTQAQVDGKFQICYYGSGNGPDPDQVRSQVASTSVPPKGYNYSRYRNPQVDQLLLDGAQTIDTQKRSVIYQQVARLMNEDLPGAWLWESTRFGAVNKRVQNFVYTPAPVFARYDDHSETWSLS